MIFQKDFARGVRDGWASAGYKVVFEYATPKLAPHSLKDKNLLITTRIGSWALGYKQGYILASSGKELPEEYRTLS